MRWAAQGIASRAVTAVSFSSHDAADGHVQSGAERVFDGLLGGVQLVGTGFAAAGPFIKGVSGAVKGVSKGIQSVSRAADALDSAGDAGTILSKAPNRGLRLPKTDGSLSGTNTLGYTTANGDVFLQPGLTRAQQAATLRHEGVHSFLSVADDAPLAALRQRVGVGAYNNSAFFNAAEEILAEGIASRSLSQGIRHAFSGAYMVRGGRVVTPLAALSEFGVGATGLGLFGYGAYEFGSWLFGDGE